MKVSHGNLYSWLALGWALTISVLLWMPSSAVSPNESILFHNADKLIHFALFAMLYLLCAKASDERDLHTSKRVVLTYVVIYAVFTELIQTCLPDRSFEIYDIIANIMGATLAYLFFNLTQN